MSKNRKICDIYLKINRFTIDLNLNLLHNKTIETQKRGETAMQIKITVDIENTDILNQCVPVAFVTRMQLDVPGDFPRGGPDHQA